ncbi:hypothetical protein BKH43_03830 [Helicobacter sp. 13S00401-1]|uniref:hypothetical protein n=1 Tax=Helicobacter sp. 13S00401-1 TaxID=1905758 RepID=UPI000BA5999E|nr:hypothetical protein [Helicobacter sp. 13S00401-1]PAF50702.1 hypothetical protein BKH43_03830 [Helicobacter sp. 13S00401-1]
MFSLDECIPHDIITKHYEEAYTLRNDIFISMCFMSMMVLEAGEIYLEGCLRLDGSKFFKCSEEEALEHLTKIVMEYYKDCDGALDFYGKILKYFIFISYHEYEISTNTKALECKENVYKCILHTTQTTRLELLESY